MVACLKRGAAGVAVLLLLGCGDGDDAPQPEPGFQLVFQDLSAALISVWGSSERDVYAVGADDGQGPLVLHYDGQGWQRLNTGTTGDLWWVTGFENGPVFFGGQNGTLLRYESGVFERLTTPGTQTIYGVWGSAPDDVWAVGGSGTDNAVAWRLDGSTLRDVPLPMNVRDRQSLFKVWGRSANDVWFVGTGGLGLRYDGQSVTSVATNTTDTLFTASGDADRVIAVGGSGNGLIVENDGSGFADVTPKGLRPPLNRLIGVHASPRGTFAVGDYGGVLERSGAGWQRVELGIEVVESFHAVWVDPVGGVWAVGGQVTTLPLVDGVLIHRGESVPGGSF